MVEDRNSFFSLHFTNWMRVRSFGMVTLPILLISLVTTILYGGDNYNKWSLSVIEILIWFSMFIAHSFLVYTTKDGINNQVLYDKMIDIENRLESQILEMNVTQQDFNHKIVDRLDSILDLMQK